MRRPWPLRHFTHPLRRFRRDEQGATAVEFALVATPFFFLLFAIIEVALVFFAQQVMDTGLGQAARLIRTGQAQSFDKAQFREEVCARVSSLFDCSGPDGLKLEVKTYNSFAEIAVEPPLDDEGNLKDDSELGYDAGSGGDIVVVRAFYDWPTIVPSISHGQVGLADGNRLLASTVAFRNEPF